MDRGIKIAAIVCLLLTVLNLYGDPAMGSTSDFINVSIGPDLKSTTVLELTD